MPLVGLQVHQREPADLKEAFKCFKKAEDLMATHGVSEETTDSGRYGWWPSVHASMRPGQGPRRREGHKVVSFPVVDLRRPQTDLDPGVHANSPITVKPNPPSNPAQA